MTYSRCNSHCVVHLILLLLLLLLRRKSFLAAQSLTKSLSLDIRHESDQKQKSDDENAEKHRSRCDDDNDDASSSDGNKVVVVKPSRRWACAKNCAPPAGVRWSRPSQSVDPSARAGRQRRHRVGANWEQENRRVCVTDAQIYWRNRKRFTRWCYLRREDGVPCEQFEYKERYRG